MIIVEYYLPPNDSFRRGRPYSLSSGSRGATRPPQGGVGAGRGCGDPQCDLRRTAATVGGPAAPKDHTGGIPCVKHRGVLDTETYEQACP